MSVSTMRKLTVFAPKDQADALIHRLMRLRCVQVREVENAHEVLARMNCDAQRADAERRVTAAGDALEILAKFSERKGLVQTRKQLDTEKFMAERYDAATKAVGRTLALKQRENACNAEMVALMARMHTLAPWLTYTVPLGTEATQSCEVQLGSFPPKTKLAAALVKSDIDGLKKLLDPGEIGGTPFLGISRPVIKAHGSSDARAICNACLRAKEYAESGIIADIERDIALMKVERSVEKA